MGRKGSCLCGALRYEVDGAFDGVWMCHCSNCRKASGGTGNTILIVPRERFRWLSGEDHRTTYALRPTYSITRCKTCGTPLPAEEDEKNIYLTAGTLDDSLDAGFAAHIFYGSRADWERDQPTTRYFVERSTGAAHVKPPLAFMVAGLGVSNLGASIAWYTRFFDRAPDMRAGDEILWDVTETATLFIEPNPAGAGSGHVTFGVTNLDVIVAGLAARGIAHEPIETYGNGVRHVSIRDPDRNLIGLAESGNPDR